MLGSQCRPALTYIPRVPYRDLLANGCDVVRPSPPLKLFPSMMYFASLPLLNVSLDGLVTSLRET